VVLKAQLLADACTQHITHFTVLFYMFVVYSVSQPPPKVI